MVSFTRLSAEPIDQRGDIETPNLVVVMDDSLLKESPAQVFYGVNGATTIIVNGDPKRLASELTELPAAKYFYLDMQGLARQTIGRSLVSAIAAAAAAKSVPAIKLDQLTEAVRSEIAEFGLAPGLVEKNLVAARAAYEQTPSIDLASAPNVASDLQAAWQAVPYLGTAQFAGPTIRHRGSAALRATGNWRTERPVIELAKCKRCFLCYLYCPEAAMRLDADNFPHVDYDHCKGCMICYEECPTDAIARRIEL